MIDLRSDTVTKPTDAMRRAMATAEVGDDEYGEDPTVNALEEAFAARVGKAAGLFVPSGTMGNQIALRLLGKPGTAIVIGRRQHPVIYELGGYGTNGTAQLMPIDDDDGILEVDDVQWLIDAGEHHWLEISAVAIENTHMPSGGTPWPLPELQAIAGLGVPMHLDGARLFNASVATGIPPHVYAAPAATVMCCLSKGLGAPVGSMLAGAADVIEAARVERKRLGGGMRQAGVIAAAGLLALNEMVDRLADDHRRAQVIAEAVAERFPETELDPDTVQTNCVVFEYRNPAWLLRGLAENGIRAGTIAPGVVRLMTHLDVNDDHVEHVRKAIAGL
jgi:threonine aldolase